LTRHCPKGYGAASFTVFEEFHMSAFKKAGATGVAALMLGTAFTQSAEAGSRRGNVGAALGGFALGVIAGEALRDRGRAGAVIIEEPRRYRPRDYDGYDYPSRRRGIVAPDFDCNARYPDDFRRRDACLRAESRSRPPGTQKCAGGGYAFKCK
jgi:hypothetical protein